MTEQPSPGFRIVGTIPVVITIDALPCRYNAKLLRHPLGFEWSKKRQVFWVYTHEEHVMLVLDEVAKLHPLGMTKAVTNDYHPISPRPNTVPVLLRWWRAFLFSIRLGRSEMEHQLIEDMGL